MKLPMATGNEAHINRIIEVTLIRVTATATATAINTAINTNTKLWKTIMKGTFDSAQLKDVAVNHFPRSIRVANMHEVPGIALRLMSLPPSCRW